MTAYQQLKAEAKRIGWPEHYRTDLTTHDRHILRHRKDIPTEFVWGLRKCGTQFIRPTGSRALDWLDAISETWPQIHWYIFEKASLTEVTHEQAREWLTERIESCKSARLLQTIQE